MPNYLIVSGIINWEDFSFSGKAQGVARRCVGIAVPDRLQLDSMLPKMANASNSRLSKIQSKTKPIAAGRGDSIAGK